MELVARKADLVRELQFFQQIVERKNTIPILANVLIETDGNSIRLLATDIEVTLTSSCEAAVDRPGSATLPAKKLYEIVRALPDGDVKIAASKDGNQVTVSAERFESKMPTMPVADFPTPPTSELANATTIPSLAFRQLIAKTQFAITGEDTRYYLNGALFVVRPESMTMVATDGHRLALATHRVSAARATRSRRSCRARRCRSSDDSSPILTRTWNSSAARTTCSFASGHAFSSRG